MMMAAGMGMGMPGMPMPAGMGIPHAMNGMVPQMLPPMSVAASGGGFAGLTPQVGEFTLVLYNCFSMLFKAPQKRFINSIQTKFSTAHL